jgi:hypothetical protein
MNPFPAPRRWLAGLFAAAAFAPPLHAGTMLSPTAVLGTDLGTLPTTALGNMINQSGLDKPFTSGVTDFDEYFTTGTPPFGQANFEFGWQSDFSFTLPLMGFVDFDLGAVHSIDRIGIWNLSLQTGNFLVSDTLGGPFVNAGSFALQNKLHFPFSYEPQIVALNGTFEARYLRFEITSTYKFDVTDTFAYAIVGEVVVDRVSASPPLAGDFDADGDVDGDDLIDWRGQFALGSGADADLDGDSDGNDFAIWQRQLGMSNSRAAGAAIPEPASLTLIGGLLPLVLRRPWRGAFAIAG